MLSLDVRRLHRKDLLAPGQIYGWHWSRDDEQIGNISVRTYGDWLELAYTWTPYGYDPRPVTCRVPIIRTACNYGGYRHWFECPDCGRGCALIYGISRRGNFACRVCQRLGYASECEDLIGRLWRKQQKLEAKLDDKWRRRKGMREATYSRIMDRIFEAEEKREDLFNVASAAFLARHGASSFEELL